MGPGFESLKAHQWPVGQVVKTEASHAFNIGSNPVRVTNSSHMILSSISRKRDIPAISWFVVSAPKRLAGLVAVGERKKGLTDTEKCDRILKRLKAEKLLT